MLKEHKNMLKFKIKISFKDYRNFILLRNLKNPISILILFLAFVFISASIMSILFWQENLGALIFYLIFLILIFIIYPALVIRGIKKTFFSNKYLQESVTYDFSDENVMLTGETFSTMYKWEHIYKIEELKNWILLFQDRRVVNLLHKPQIPLGDLQELKEMIIKKNIKRKLLN